MSGAIGPDIDARLRHLRGRGESVPQARWPRGARLALSFVLNVEEGSESHVLDGDSASEHRNSDVVADPWPGRRNPVIESHYAYGSRVGVWRLLELFRNRSLPLTAFVTGQALERLPAVAARLIADGHEVAAHGWRWIDYRDVASDTEADHIARTVTMIHDLTGTAPRGWYTGRVSENTRALILAHGGFLYDSDAYDDDTPYFVNHSGGRHLVLPYAFDTNDMRFASAPGFDTGRDWLDYLIDSFDVLWREGADRPRMMSIGLHCRLAGRPGRVRALERFLDHVAARGRVWIARRDAIALHWTASEP